MRPYADTNFLVPLYLNAGPCDEAERTLRQAVTSGMPPLPLTPLLWMEVMNAFELHVYFARTQGQWRVSPEATASAAAHFADDVDTALFFCHASPAWEVLRRQMHELSLRHTARHGFRTYDLLHVSAALLLGCDCFWSFDHKARQLAEMEGLMVNPL